MFESGTRGAELERPEPLTTGDLRAFLCRLPSIGRSAADDAERIEQIALLESIKHAAAGQQARVSVDFDASQIERQAAEGVPARRRGRGVAAQIALARRDPACRGSRHLGLAKALVHELSHAMAHLEGGRVSEWRVTLLCRETAVLDVEHRREVDRRLGPVLPQLGDAEVVARARALAYELDPQSPLRRARGANENRRVTIRPAPDTMTLLTGFLPVAQGVAAFASLDAHAKALLAKGDGRTQAQIMADTLVERLTGQATAGAVPLEVQLVMPAMTLLGVGDEPALEPTHGAVLPAAFARSLVESCQAAGAPVWLRRLFASPDEADLVSLESRRRRYGGQLRHLIALRDQTCRTLWCDAPIRHIDHVSPARAAGATSAGNGQGTCAACNLAKEAPGWRAESVAHGPTPGDPHAPPHSVRTTTPTGHSYDSTAPPILPGRSRAAPEREERATGQVLGWRASALEQHLEDLLAAA